MRVGVAYIDVRVNLTKFNKDLATVKSLATGTVDSVNTTFAGMSASHSKLKRSAGGAATGMDKVTAATNKQKRGMLSLVPHVAMVTAAYMAMRVAWRSVVDALTVGVQFEQKMSVVKAVSRATAEDFEKLSTAARKMAADTIFTAVQTADALKYLAMAGMDATESIAALPGVLNLALIGELELGRATDIATDTLRAFGMEADEIGRVTDVMVSVITRSNTNIEMMGQAMKFAAPIAHQLGYEIEQVAAMIGTLAQSGIKRGIAGRGLQQSFIRTLSAAKKLGLGIGTDLIGVLKKYKEMQEELEKTHNKVYAREKMAMIITKDYGRVALKNVLVLKENIEKYEELADAAYLSAGETARAAWIMQDNVDSAFKRLISVLADISIEIFDKYKESLKNFLVDTMYWFKDNKDAMVELARTMIEFAKEATILVKLAALYAGLMLVNKSVLVLAGSTKVFAAFRASILSASVSTALFTSSVVALKASLLLVFSLIGGLMIGKKLYEDYEWARLAGLGLVDSLIKGWMHFEHFFSIVMLSFKKLWVDAITVIENVWLGFLEILAAASELVPVPGVSFGLRSYLDELKAEKKAKEEAGKATFDYDAEVKKLTEDYKKALITHDEYIESIRKAAVAYNDLKEAERAAREEDALLKLAEIAREKRRLAEIKRGLDALKDPMAEINAIIDAIDKKFMMNLSDGLKEAVEQAIRFTEYQDKIKDRLFAIKDKHGETAYQAAVGFEVKKYKEREKFAKRFAAVAEKLALAEIKQDEDKYAALIKKARTYEAEALKVIKNADAQQLAAFNRLGFTKVAVEKHTAKQIILINQQKNKAGLKEQKKFSADIMKYEKKTAIYGVKVQEDAFAAKIKAAEIWKEEMLKRYEDYTDEQKDILFEQGKGMIAIAQATEDRIAIIRAEKTKSEMVSIAKKELKAYEELYKDSYRQREDYHDKAVTLEKKLLDVEMKERIAGGMPEKDAYAWRAVQLKEYTKELEGTFGSWEDMSERTADAIEDNFSDFFKDAFHGELDSAADYFQAFLDSLLDSFSDMMGQMAKEAMFGGGSSGGSGWFGLAASAAKAYFSLGAGGTTSGLGGLSESQTAGALFHGGGTAGYGTVPMRTVSSSLFANAPRLHKGLEVDEFPAILQRGERVIPKGGDNTIRDEASIKQIQKEGDYYNVNINAVDSKSFVDLMDRNPQAVLTTVNRALERNTGDRHKMKRMVK